MSKLVDYIIEQIRNEVAGKQCADCAQVEICEQEKLFCEDLIRDALEQ